MGNKRGISNSNSNSNSGSGSSRSRRRLVFTYGTLKRGFSNHRLMEDLIDSGHASFVGACCTSARYPLVCGPYRVPFLLNMPGRGDRVCGEVYEVSDVALARMDELEGITRGHYQRLPINLNLSLSLNDSDSDSNVEVEVEGEAYFAHPSYAEDLWRKNGEIGYGVYSEKEATGYVKRKDRPQHLTFLDQISLFLSDSPPNS